MSVTWIQSAFWWSRQETCNLKTQLEMTMGMRDIMEEKN